MSYIYNDGDKKAKVYGGGGNGGSCAEGKPCNCNCDKPKCCKLEKPEIIDIPFEPKEIEPSKPCKKCPEVITEVKPLPGVEFELIEKKCGCVIACGKTNAKGELKFDCLPLGDYAIREVKGCDGYDFDDKPVDVDLSPCHPDKCVEVHNHMHEGSIEVHKFGDEEKFVCHDENCEDGNDDDQGEDGDNNNQRGGNGGCGCKGRK